MSKADDGYAEFLVEYHYKGEKWALHLMASSHEDAEARLHRIALGNVLGQIQAVYPVKTPKWYVGLVCWWRTLWEKL